MKNLKHFLDCNNYSLLIREACGSSGDFFTNPFPSYGSINMNLFNFSEKQRRLVSFFLLGNGILTDEFYSFIGESVYNELSNENLIEDDGLFIRLKRFSITVHQGFYLFADRPYYYTNPRNLTLDVYIGPDSFNLSSIIPRMRAERALDLCTGSGIQSFILSNSSNVVDAVDINDDALLVANLNSRLNGISNVKFIKSDLFDKLKDKEYDLIVSNPPFIPFTDKQDFYSIAGSGGLNGLSIIDKILLKCDNHLKKQGSLIISAEGLSDIEGKLLIEHSIKNLLPVGYETKLFVLNEFTIKTYMERIFNFCYLAYQSEKIESSREELMKYFNKNNIIKYHSFVLQVHKIEAHVETVFERINLFKEVSKDTRFNLNIESEHIKFVESNPTFNLLYKENSIAIVDSEAKVMLESPHELSATDKHGHYCEKKAEVLKKLEISRIIKRSRENGN